MNNSLAKGRPLGPVQRKTTFENDQNMYRKAVKLLGHNRTETGEPMSHTVEQLILNHTRIY